MKKAIIITALITCGLIGGVNAQEKTAMSVDQTLRSNARVNPSTLGMELSIPLGTYPGRGGMDIPITLQYSSKLWRTEYLGTDVPVSNNDCRSHYTPRYSELSASGWTTDVTRPYIEYTGWDNVFDAYGKPARQLQFLEAADRRRTNRKPSSKGSQSTCREARRTS